MFQRLARCRALIAQHAQVMPIPLRALAMTVEQQPLEFVVVLALERQRKHIVIVPRREQLPRLFRQLLIDPTRQLTDAAAFTETPRVTQHHHLLGQRMRAVEIFVQTTVLQRLHR